MIHIRIDHKSFTKADDSRAVIIENFMLDLARESFTTLLGPSGCGKSTLLRIILGLDRDFVGSITPETHALRVGAVFQEPTLLPWRSVNENILLAAPNISVKRLESLLSTLELDGIGEQFPHTLSLGMARRVALARAFAIDPELLILDEPFVSLDEALTSRLHDYLIKLNQRHKPTVLMVSHSQEEATRLSDRIITLNANPMRIHEDILV